MWTIIRRNAFWYFFHMMWFGFPLYNFVFNEGRRGYLVFLTLMAPVWLCSSVLWSERHESYAFLRMLPVRDRDVVRAKLRLGLCGVFAYWLLLTLYTLLAWGTSPAFFGRFSLINIMTAVALVLITLCYLGVWRFGARAMTTPILVFMGITFVLVFALGIRLWRDHDFGDGLKASPWPVQVALPLAALVAWRLMSRAAPRIKWTNEAHLQMP